MAQVFLFSICQYSYQYMRPGLHQGVLYMHHFNAQISPPLDSYTNVQAMHVCMIANISSVCFSQGCFLERIRRPRVLRLPLVGSAGC